MRILMVSQFFPPVIGGEERIVEALSVGLSRRGHRVVVATLQCGDLPAEDLVDGVSVHRIRGAAQRCGPLYSDPARPHAPPVPDPLLTRELFRLIRRERPDVIHGHNWMTHSLFPLRRRLRSPLVLSLHDHSLICATRRFVHGGKSCSGPAPLKCVACASGHYGPVKGVPVAVASRLMQPLVLSAVDMFLPVSHAVARRARLADAGARWRVLPNFVNGDAPPGESEDGPAGLPEDGFTLFVGDMTRDKGVELLLDAYAGLEGVPPLVLIGRPSSPRLAPPPPNVVVLGPRVHDEVMQAWRRCGVGVIPSITEEAFGLAALEAMAAGRPVVAANHGGLAELVADGKSGLLVPPGDRVALRDALDRLHHDAPLRERLGAGASRHARGFTPAAVLPQLEDVYRELIAAGNGDVP